MANNVDLMVVGAADGMTAAELTQKLVREFGQPAEAFTDLVAAACGGGPKYAAQTGVTLDTAVEGQGKLEDFGVVCELVVDGKPVPSSGIGRPRRTYQSPGSTAAAATSATGNAGKVAPAPAPAAPGATTPDVADTQASAQATPAQATPASATPANDATKPEESGSAASTVGSAAEVSAEQRRAEPADEAAHAQASVEDGFGDIAISFDDEIEALGSSLPGEASAAEPVAADESLSDISIDFGDEIDTLDVLVAEPGEVVATVDSSVDDASNLPADHTGIDTNVAMAADGNDAMASTPPAAGNEQTGQNLPPEISPGAVSGGGEFELSLSDDIDTPLTKPKETSGMLPDTSGLSLVDDDEPQRSVVAQHATPITSPSPQPGEGQVRQPATPEGAVAPPGSGSAGAVAGTSVEDAQFADNLANDPFIADDPVSEGSPDNNSVADKPPGADLRDTSREPVEIAPPVAAPAEEPPAPATESDATGSVVSDSQAIAASAEPAAAGGSENLAAPAGRAAAEVEAEQSADDSSQPLATPDSAAVDVPSSQPDHLANDALAAIESITKPSPDEPASADSGADISTFIDSLVGDIDDGADTNTQGGGLVLPGQTAQPQAEPAATYVADDAADDASVAANAAANAAASAAASEQSDDTPVSMETILENSRKSYAPEITGSGGMSEDFLRRRKRKRVAMAVAAFCMVGVGAVAVVVQNGIIKLPSAASFESVASVVTGDEPADQSAELEAVAEVSLNAALERSVVRSNPDNYSTEDLIAYLAEGLGENARDELKNYISGEDVPRAVDQTAPRMAAAIHADSDSELWLRNRVEHPADKYFDEWSRREVDLEAYLELQGRLIQGGDLNIAIDVSRSTKDKLFAVMSQQRLAKAFHDRGQDDQALEVLDMAVRGTFAIQSKAERVMAIADHAAVEEHLGLSEDSADSFLKAQILARSVHQPANRTIAFSALAERFHRAGRNADASEFLEQAVTAAYELPMNTAARDLAIRHVALTEVRLGMTDKATEHANMIVDPFAAVSALHGIALELEQNGEEKKARLTLNMAYRAGSLISDSDKREKLLEKIKLAGY